MSAGQAAAAASPGSSSSSSTCKPAQASKAELGVGSTSFKRCADTAKTSRRDWGHMRLLGSLRAAPAAAAARLSPEASPRPHQPGLSLNAAERAAAEAWELVELVAEGEVQEAEAGWRDVLREKRAKLRGRVTELDIRHAAARIIQVGLLLPATRLPIRGGLAPGNCQI
ncbi:hypothetical protein COO60DRAFT_1643587 [Scenedesmus sp. NREL 46B-D3]|nr:hypothetical protein COO60DRAFT_1643587 [Scenedesmus sp. NREL 46B-D3]